MPSPILTTLISAATTAMTGLASATAGASASLAGLVSNATIGRLQKLGQTIKKSFTGIFTDDINLAGGLASLFPVIGQTRAAFQLLTGTVQKFSASTVGAISEIESGVRQAATTISSAVDVQMKGTGDVISDTLKELELIEPKLREIQENLIKAAPNLVGVTTGDLLTTFNQVSIQFGQLAGQVDTTSKAIQDAAKAANISVQAFGEFEAAEAISKNLASAMKVVGLTQREINQEVRALFTGDIDVNARLARQLNITRAQILEQKAQGNLAGFLLEKTKDIANANIRYNDSLSNTTSVLKDIADQFGRDIGRPIFEQASQSLLMLRKTLTEIQKEGVFQRIGESLGDDLGKSFDSIVQSVENLFTLIAQNEDAIKDTLSFTVATLGEAIRAFIDIGTVLVGMIPTIIEWGEKIGEAVANLTPKKDSKDGIKEVTGLVGELGDEVNSLEQNIEPLGGFGLVLGGVFQNIVAEAEEGKEDFVQELEETEGQYAKFWKSMFKWNDLAVGGGDIVTRSVKDKITDPIQQEIMGLNEALTSATKSINAELEIVGKKYVEIGKKINEVDLSDPELGKKRLQELTNEFKALDKKIEEITTKARQNTRETFDALGRLGNTYTQEAVDAINANTEVIIENEKKRGATLIGLQRKLVDSKKDLSDEEREIELKRIQESESALRVAIIRVERDQKRLNDALASGDTERINQATINYKNSQTELARVTKDLTKESLGLAQAFGVIQKELEDLGDNATQAAGFVSKFYEAIIADGKDAITVLKDIKSGVENVSKAGAAVNFFDPEQVEKNGAEGVKSIIDIIDAAAQQTRGLDIAQRVDVARTFKDIEAENLKTIKAQNKFFEKQIEIKEKTGQISSAQAKADKTRLKLAEDEEAVIQQTAVIVAQRATIDSNADEKRRSVYQNELRILENLKVANAEYKKIEFTLGSLSGKAKEEALARMETLKTTQMEAQAALEKSFAENEVNAPLLQQQEAKLGQLKTQQDLNKATLSQQDFEAETAAIVRKTTQDKVAGSRALTKELDLIADKVANLEFTEAEGKLASIEARQRENEGRRIANGEMINQLELKRQLIKEGHLDVTQAEADKVETDLNVAYEETKQIEQERRDIGNEMVDVIDMQVDKMRDVKKATHDSKTAALEMKMALESIELKELKNQLDLAPQVDDFLDKLPELNDMMKDPSIPSHWKSFFAGMKADTKALAKDFAGLVQEGPDSVTTVKNRLKLLEKVQEKELKMMKDQQKLQELEQQHVIDMIALDIMRNEAIINGGLEELETQKQVLLTMGKKLDIAELLGELSQWEKERADEIKDSIEDQAEDIDGITKSRKKQAQEENKLLKSQMRQAEEKLKYLKMTGASNIEIKKQQQEVDRLKAKWREAKGEVGEYKDEIASGGKPGSRKRREETTGKNFKRLGSESRNMGQFVSSFVSHLTEKQLEMYKQGIALLKEEGKDINQMFREAAKNSNSISQRLAAGEAVPGLSTFSMNRKNQSELNAMRNLASQIAFQAAGAIRAQEQAARDAKRHADRDARIQENKLEHQRKVEAINARIAENTRVEAQEGIDLLSALLEETKQARIEAAQQALTALEESRAFAMSFIEKVAPADDATVFDLFRTLSPSEGDAGDTVQDQAAWEAVAAIFGEEAANKLSGLVTINKDFVDAFKEGTVKPEDLIQDNKVFLDPESGEIILTGKDPNFDKLQELVELVSLKKINQDQLDVLNQIAGNQLSYEDFENLGVVDEDGVIFGLGFGTEGAIPVDVVRGNETLAQTLERLNARYLKTLALQEDLDLATLEAGQSLKDLEPDALTWDELVDLSDREGYDNTLIKELAGNLAALAGAETKEAFDDGIKVDKAKIDVAQRELDIVSAPDLFADAAKFGYDVAALQDFVDKNPAKTQDIIDRLAAGKLTSVGALIETGVPKADAGTLANIENILNKAVNRDDPVPESTGGKVTVPRGSGTYDATNDAIKNKKFDGDGTATLASLNNFLPQELRNADAKKKYFGSANNLHEITPEQLDAAITAINNPVSVDTGTGQSSNVQYVNPATGQVVSTNLNTSGGSYETFIPTTGNDTSSDTVGMLTQTGVGSIGLTPPPQGTFFGFNTLRAPAQPGESNGVIANNTQNSVLNGGNNAGNTNIQIINMNTNLNKGLSLAGTEGI